MLKYMGPLFLVDDIAMSRHFYEELLGQKVKYDYGVNVTFEGDFAVHLKSHYQALLGDATQYPIGTRTHNGVLGFETDDIELIDQRLRRAGIEFIHAIREQPWGQRVLRVYDPDGHIVEIGEAMDTVVWRFYSRGMSVDQVAEKTGMPREFVEKAIEGARCI